MSRKTAVVSVENAAVALGVLVEKVREDGMPDLEGKVKVAYGYDRPCASYFIDLEPHCEIGVYYGGLGLTRKLDKGQFHAALLLIGRKAEAKSFALDLPF